MTSLFQNHFLSDSLTLITNLKIINEEELARKLMKIKEMKDKEIEKNENVTKTEKSGVIIEKMLIESDGFKIHLIFKLNRKRTEIEILNENSWEIQPKFYRVDNLIDYQKFLKNEIKYVKNFYLIIN